MHPDAAYRAFLPDAGLIIRAVDVDVTRVGVTVMPLHAGETEDAGQDEVALAVLALRRPYALLTAAAVNGVDRVSRADLLTDLEAPQRGLITCLLYTSPSPRDA